MGSAKDRLGLAQVLIPPSYSFYHRLADMVYWVHIARSIDRVTLHKERCSEVPANVFSSDFWEGGWFDYPDKERALRAMEQAGTNVQRRCALCRP